MLDDREVYVCSYVYDNAQRPRTILGIIGRDPSVSKSNRLHIDIFRVSLMKFETYSLDSPKTRDSFFFPEALNSTPLFLKLVENLPIHWRIFSISPHIDPGFV